MHGRALVTGGSGVVGRALVAALLGRGTDVTVFDLRPPPGLDVRFLGGDVRELPALLEATAGCAAVFHLAAALPQARLAEPSLRALNVGGTRNVAEACVRNAVPRLVFASTIEVYGPQAVDAPLDEDAPKLLTGPYSRTKLDAEELLAGF